MVSSGGQNPFCFVILLASSCSRVMLPFDHQATQEDSSWCTHGLASPFGGKSSSYGMKQRSWLALAYRSPFPATTHGLKPQLCCPHEIIQIDILIPENPEWNYAPCPSKLCVSGSLIKEHEVYWGILQLRQQTWSREQEWVKARARKLFANRCATKDCTCHTW